MSLTRQVVAAPIPVGVLLGCLADDLTQLGRHLLQNLHKMLNLACLELNSSQCTHIKLRLEGVLSSGWVHFLVPCNLHPEVSSSDLSVSAGHTLQHGIMEEAVLLLLQEKKIFVQH